MNDSAAEDVQALDYENYNFEGVVEGVEEVIQIFDLESVGEGLRYLFRSIAVSKHRHLFYQVEQDFEV